MTAPATTRRAGPFAGNGVTTSFPFTFKVFTTADVEITYTSTAGVDLILSLGAHYTVVLNVDQDASPGGTITYPVAGTPLATGEILTVIGALPYDQPTDLPSGGNYRASTVENALDRTVFQIQQLAEELSRSLTLPPSASTAVTRLPNPTASNVIGWNAGATALVNYPPADLSFSTLQTNLAAYSSAADGAGMVGFDASLNYVAGTIGQAVKVFNPTLYPWLADATGATDATAAINACSVAAGTKGRLEFPPGSTFKVIGGLLCASSYQHWFGYGATLVFAPTADGSLVSFKMGDGTTSIWGCGLHGFTLTSADSTYNKTALDIWDARKFTCTDVIITGTVDRAGVNTFSGGTTTTGVHIRGRELISFDRTYISADQPLHISPSSDPTAAGFGVGYDQSAFNDTILIGYQKPKILIDTATIITQIKFTGYCSFNRGRQGILWLDTTGTIASNGLTFDELRSEQEENAADFVIDIQHTSTTLQALKLRGGYWGVGSNGIRLRGVTRARLDTVYHGGAATVALDVDATVDGIDADNCFWQQTSTAALTGQRIVWGAPHTLSGQPLPPSFKMQPSASVRRTLQIGGGVGEAPITLANNATQSLGADLRGLLAVTTSEGFAAMFIVHGTQSTCELIASTTATAYFSNTATTASKVNVYWSGSAYVIENKRGASVNVQIHLAGSYGSF